ncbi:hypothetical protein B0T19DRAFT_244561 [Cercophora scortea]|uniref:Uncharacterized protein n=1 Tax=Cercophora scortea TaxID=314031 RepID=A0AAE0M5X1_9PEZI|nr:hypothetical protein B0T19DRAFT_244561 [Cercophora scortea]
MFWTTETKKQGYCHPHHWVWWWLCGLELGGVHGGAETAAPACLHDIDLRRTGPYLSFCRRPPSSIGSIDSGKLGGCLEVMLSRARIRSSKTGLSNVGIPAVWVRALRECPVCIRRS